MRSKVTVVLLFLNVILFYYIFQFEEKWRAERATLEARKRVLGPEVAAIESLTRTSRTGAALKLERHGEAWRLTQPYDWPANPNAVARVLNELQFLEHETSFAVADLAKSGQSLADYGLDHPAITLGFSSAGKTYTLKIGDDTMIGNRLYVLSPDGGRIHVVGRSLADSVGLPLDALRAETIFTVPVFEVRSLNVQTAALKVRLRRDAASRWTFETPILARASKSAVEVTINALNALNARNFLEPAGPDLERTGLNLPALRITLEGNARRETLLLGNPVAGGTTLSRDDRPAAPEFYAKIEDKAVVFTVPVPQPLLDVLRSAQEALRDPHVLDFETGTVTALTLNAPGQPELALQRLEAGAGAAAWQVVVHVSGQAPQTIPADTPLVDELIQKIHLLAATKFLSDAPSAADLENDGFNRPERELTLNLSSGGGLRGTDPSTLTLQIGVKPDERGKAYARATKEPFVYQIVPEILEQTPVLARYYRQRLLRELPEGAKILGLSLTDTAAGTPVFAKQLTQTVPTWDQALADEPEARRKAIGAALTQLHTLRARQFTADTFTPDHAETAQGPHPWKYQLDVNIAFAGGKGAAENATSTLFLTDRLGGNTQLAGTAEFGGVVFEVSQELLDALFTLTYRGKNDPGLPVPPPVVETPGPKT
jgi:hypothetical protein